MPVDAIVGKGFGRGTGGNGMQVTYSWINLEQRVVDWVLAAVFRRFVRRIGGVTMLLVSGSPQLETFHKVINDLNIEILRRI